jgi:1-deoxy-D-xylulose-5-phosphate synthase
MLQIGKGRMIRSGKDIAILSLGPVGIYAKEACDELAQEDIFPAHFDLRFFKSLDEELLHKVFREFRAVITLEDGCVTGGVGTAVIEFMVVNNYQSVIKHLGLPDEFAVQGGISDLYALYGYDKKGVVAAVKSLTNKVSNLEVNGKCSILA